MFRAELVVADRPPSLDDTHLGLFLTLEEGADSAVVSLRLGCMIRGSKSPPWPDPWRMFSCSNVRRGERSGRARVISLRDLGKTVPSHGKLRLNLRLNVSARIRAHVRPIILHAVTRGAPAKCFGQQLRESAESSADVAFVVQRRGKKKTFPVHKLVLTSRSEVFSAMFGNPDTQESNSMTVVIRDMGFQGAEDFLQLMYTDKCGALEESCKNLTRLKQLLRAVDKYQVLPLKDRLADKLFSILTPDNAGRIALMAETYSLPNLTDALVTELAMPGNSLGRKWMTRAPEDFKMRVLRAMGEEEVEEEAEAGEENSSEDEDDDDSLS